MQILPSHPMTQYIHAVELNGEPVNATFIDMETGRIQYWNAGEQVEGFGKVQPHHIPLAASRSSSSRTSLAGPRAAQRVAAQASVSCPAPACTTAW